MQSNWKLKDNWKVGAMFKVTTKALLGIYLTAFQSKVHSIYISLYIFRLTIVRLTIVYYWYINVTKYHYGENARPQPYCVAMEGKSVA